MIEIIFALIIVHSTPRAASHVHDVEVRYYETQAECESIAADHRGAICLPTIKPQG